MNQAQLYSKYNGLQKNDAAYILENYLRLIKWNPEGNDSVLDVGCGAGDVTLKLLLPLLPGNIKKLIGADLSDEMVEFAKGQNENEKVSFICIDISSEKVLVDLEEEFDHIFSFYCLHWVQNQKQALKNLYQLLKPGGDMLITFLASNPIFHIYENLSANSKWGKYMQNTKKYISPYQSCQNPEKVFEKLLTEAGFSTHLCKVIERKYVYTDITVWRKSVIAVSPFIRNIPENLHNDYLTDFINEFKTLYCTDHNDNYSEEKIKVPYKLFVVVASKSR